MRKRTIITQEQKVLILEMYHKGLKLKPMSDQLGIPPSTISGFLISKYGYRTNPSVNEEYFSVIDSHNKAYILGFIAADGCITKSKSNKNYALSIRLNEKDIDVIEFIKKEMDSTHKIFKYTQKLYNSNMVAISITREKISRSLINLGITPRKSLTLGNIIKNIDEQFRKSFILGYFDGDGSIHIDTKRNRGTISMRGTYDMLSGILNELKMDLSVRKYDSTYTITIGSKKLINEFKKIYGYTDFYLKRKYDKINNPTILYIP